MATLFDSASLVMIPSGYKDDKLYSIKPEPLYGAELITNGSFTTDSNWTKETGWTISGGTANYNGSASTNALLQSASLVTGKVYRVKFDVVNHTNGTIRAYLSNGSTTGASPLVYGNGSYSFDITATGPAIVFRNVQNFNGSIDNVSVQEVLVSGDFTFSRDGAGASPATRVNASGLIEKGRENLLLQSNTFTTSWSTSNSTLTSGQSGYDGSSDAWLLEATGTTSARIQQGVSISGVHTTSIYAKAGTTDWIAVQMFSNHFAYFDVANGVVGGTGSAIDAKIESVGGGWYRCSLTYNASSVTNAWVYVIDGNGSTSVTIGANVYLQAAQVEQGLVATDYIETTTAPVSAGLLGDMPRLDYSGGATCPSLLLEGSRVNLVTQSEYFGGSDWSKFNTTITSNDITSPSGFEDASLATSTAGGDFKNILTLATNTTYTASFYVKRGTAADAKYRVYNFDAGVNVVADTSYISQTSTSEWTRVDFTFTTGATGTSHGIYLLQDASAGTMYFWGAQLEAGSYPTSYIPTYGSASTRGADVCRAPYNAIADKTEATLVVEYEQPIAQPSGLNHIAGYRDNSNADFYILQIGSSNNHELRWRGQNGTAISLSIAIDEATYGLHRKVAFVKTNDKLIGYCNGVKIGETSSGSTNAFSTNPSEELDLWYSGFVESNSIKQLLVIPSALTNSEAIALTTI